MQANDQFQLAAAEIQSMAGPRLDNTDRADLLALTDIIERRGIAACAAGEQVTKALIDLVCAVETLFGVTSQLRLKLVEDQLAIAEPASSAQMN